MKRNSKPKAIAAALFAAVILFTATSCQFVADDNPGGSVQLSPIPSTPKNSSSDPSASPSTSAEPTTDPSSSNEPEDSGAHQAPPDNTTAPDKTFINPLTGETVKSDPNGLRPIAVVVDNCGSALAHQSGIDKASVLFETLVAPGITRFLAIYPDYRTIDEICNIRAGRVHDAEIAANFGAVLICHDGHSDEIKDFDFFSKVAELFGSASSFIDTQKEPAWTAQAGEVLGTIKYYGKDDRTDLKYDTILTSDSIDYLFSSQKISDFANSGYSMNGDIKNTFAISNTPISGDSADRVTLTFTASGVNSSLTKNVSFKYSSDGTYLRFEDSRPHIDSKSGAQLNFKNVIALFTDVKYIAGDSDVDPLTTSITTYGSGTGYYFSGGKYTSIIWINDAENGLRLYTPNGELSISTGNTYIAYLDKTNVNSIKITSGS